MMRLLIFIRLVQIFTPWVRRFIVGMVSYWVITIITFWGAVPAKVEAIANEWLDRADLAGFPGDHLPKLYWVFYVIAFGMIILGWIGLSYATTFIVHLLL